jgi:hypothetical protein
MTIVQIPSVVVATDQVDNPSFDFELERELEPELLPCLPLL